MHTGHHVYNSNGILNCILTSCYTISYYIILHGQRALWPCDNTFNPLLQLTADTGSESDSDGVDIAQTLLEIDYETAVDDEDVVDEFLAFKTTLQGTIHIYVYFLIFFIDW